MNTRTLFCGVIAAGAVLWLVYGLGNASTRQGGVGYNVSYGTPNQIGAGLFTNSGLTGPYYNNPGRYTVDADVYTPLFVSALFDHGSMGVSFYSITNLIFLPAATYLDKLYPNAAGTIPWDDFVINFLLLNSRTSVYFKKPLYDYGFFVERGWQAYLYSQDQYDCFVHEIGCGAVVDYKVVARLGIFYDHCFNNGSNNFLLKMDVSRYAGW
jgi:hypothetical protein